MSLVFLKIIWLCLTRRQHLELNVDVILVLELIFSCQKIISADFQLQEKVEVTVLKQ